MQHLYVINSHYGIYKSDSGEEFNHSSPIYIETLGCQVAGGIRFAKCWGLSLMIEYEVQSLRLYECLCYVEGLVG